MADFQLPDYTPVYPITKAVKPRQRKAKLPDWGTEQRATVGQNQTSPEWDVRWVLDPAQANTLDAFLAERAKNGEWFLWTPPGGAQGRFRCEEWTKTLTYCSIREVRASFRQVFSYDLPSIGFGAGYLALSGREARLVRNRILRTVSGSLVLTGSELNGALASLALLDAGQFALTGRDASLAKAAPATFDISFIGSATAASPVQTAVAPTHQIGDLLIVISSVASNRPFPALSGFTTLFSALTVDGSNAIIALQYRYASSTAYTVPSWGGTGYGADNATILVYRNALIGASATNQTSPRDYPALTFSVTNNSSWALKLLGVGAANGFNTPASGFTMRRQQYFCVFSDSNAGVSSQSAETVAGGVGETLGATVELVAGQAPPSDPAFANVQLLLRGEGANGGATFADSSLFNKPMTRTGSATTSTAQFKYGTSSLFFQNSGAIRMTSTSADPWISMGTGLYTVEFWAYVTTNGTMFDNGSITITGMFGALRVRYNSNSSNLIVSGTTLGATWTHIAVVQNAASTVLYINGVNSGSAGFIVGTNSVSFTPIGDSNFAGYIDEVRVTKGVARYTANFTPPAAEFPRL